MQIQLKSFTAIANSRANVLLSDAFVCQASNASDLPDGSEFQFPAEPKRFVAIWDTGATNTVVTQRVIDECGLKPTGMAKVHTAQGSMDVPTYLVGLGLPNRVAIPQLRVSRGEIAGEVDVLIGMDVITLGDFAVTQKDGKTAFSFRIPSAEFIDFVKNPPRQLSGSTTKYPETSRSALCPCGSGKKYKRCHGKTT